MDNTQSVSKSTQAVEIFFQLFYPTLTCLGLMWALMRFFEGSYGSMSANIYLILILAIPMVIHFAWVRARYERRATHAEEDLRSEVERSKNWVESEIDKRTNIVEQEGRRKVADILATARSLIVQDEPGKDELAALISMLEGERSPNHSTITDAEYDEFRRLRARIDPELYDRVMRENEKLRSRLENDNKHFSVLADLLKGLIFTFVNTDFGKKNQLAGKLRRRTAAGIFQVWGDKSSIWEFVTTLCREQGIDDVMDSNGQA